MRAPTVCVLSVLITLCTPSARGQDQPGNAQTVEGINAQDADPKPCKSGESTAPNSVRDSRNHPDPETPVKPPSQSPYGPQGGIPAVPANPNPTEIFPPFTSQRLDPQSVYFEILFDMMSVYNMYAERDEEAGKHLEAELEHTNFQRAAGLNDIEGELLQEIEHDCICALRELDAKTRAVAEKFRAQIVPGTLVTIPTELIQMYEDRKTIVRDHVERLRLALGETSFNKLEAYIFSMFHVEENSAKPKTPSTTTTAKSEKESR